MRVLTLPLDESFLILQTTSPPSRVLQNPDLGVDSEKESIAWMTRFSRPCCWFAEDPDGDWGPWEVGAITMG